MLQQFIKKQHVVQAIQMKPGLFVQDNQDHIAQVGDWIICDGDMMWLMSDEQFKRDFDPYKPGEEK